MKKDNNNKNSLLNTLYSLSNDKQKAEIKEILSEDKHCSRCGEKAHKIKTACRYFGSGVGGMDI